MMRAMTGINALREHSRITWIEQEHGWAATPEDIVTVLSNEGFEECKREQTTSRPNRRPAGGLWQGVNPRTGSVASAIWVNRPAWPHDIVFIEVDGESLAGGEDGGGDPWTEAIAPRGAGAGSQLVRTSQWAQRARERTAMGHEPDAQQTTSRTLGREHGDDPSHAAEGAHAVSGRARPEAREDGRGVPSLGRDPYQDEGGEG